MSDIRNFFEGGRSTRKSPAGASSALSQAREARTPERRKPGATGQKRPSSHSSEKEKRPVVESIEDSDGEDPLPASVRKQAMKQRAGKRAVLLSDSDEDGPPVLKPQKPAVEDRRTSPRKTTKRARIDDDESPQKPAKTSVSKKPPPIEEEEEEMVSATDSEDEFREVKKPKKDLAKGQTRLQFEKGAAKQDGKKAPASKTVDPTDFFGSSKGAATTTTKSTTAKRPTAGKKSAETSPSQKENAHRVVTPRKNTHGDANSDAQTDVIVVPAKPAVAKSVSPSKPTARKVPVLAPAKPPVSLAVTTPKVNLPDLLPWVDKYKPRNASQLVGMNGDKSPWNKLIAWLRDWANHNLGDASKVKKARPPPWMASQDGSSFKAALLSGPPGVGKTTCAKLSCEHLGFQCVEMNASDVRNKKHLEAHIAHLTGCHQLEEYFGRPLGSNNDVKHVLIMDEVDGMSGNEDRAGISELIDIIKTTKIPIICICNDRSHPKIRSLANYCFDVRFPRPRVEQIRSRVMSIALQEKVRMTKEEVDELIELSNHDVRQCIYNLQMRGIAPEAVIQQKDVTLSVFEAARRLLSKSTSIVEKQEMFFVDYGIMPLFAQENYLHLTNNDRSPVEQLGSLRRAADLISWSDIVDRQIRSGGAWRLLPEQAMLSAVLPAIAMDGHLRTQILFPQWLGKNSSSQKRHRLARQLLQHAHLKISADTHSLVTDYVPVLRERITRPLIEKELQGVGDVVSMFVDYNLVRDDTEAINELAIWPGRKDPGAVIQSKTKASLTRALGKELRCLPYATEETGKGKRRGPVADLEVEMDEEGKVIEKGGEGVEEDEEADEEGESKPAPASTGGRGGSTGARGGRGGGRGGARGGARGRGRGR